jgi:hypothetical protein
MIDIESFRLASTGGQCYATCRAARSPVLDPMARCERLKQGQAAMLLGEA